MRATVSERRLDDADTHCPWTRALVEVQPRYRAISLMLMFAVGIAVARIVSGIPA